MGRTTTPASTEARRAEWLLDRIRRGQFYDLSGMSAGELDSLFEQAGRAFAALPEAREADRGRLMLLQGRVKLELQARRNKARKPTPKANPRMATPTPGRALQMMSSGEFKAYCAEMTRGKDGKN